MVSKIFKKHVEKEIILKRDLKFYLFPSYVRFTNNTNENTRLIMWIIHISGECKSSLFLKKGPQA